MYMLSLAEVAVQSLYTDFPQKVNGMLLKPLAPITLGRARAR